MDNLRLTAAIILCLFTACSSVDHPPAEQSRANPLPAGNDELIISTAVSRASLNLSRLALELPITSIEIHDPIYKKDKRYAAYELLALLKLARVSVRKEDTLVFKALDGYEARVGGEELLRGDPVACLAVRDLEAVAGWESLQAGKQWISPAPYYLIWVPALLGAKSATAPEPDSLPWPYQVVEITLESEDLVQQRLSPAGADKETLHGYEIFRQNCLCCHSLNLLGGSVGPELNVPRNVTEYWDSQLLRLFISDPTSFRARDRMPTFRVLLGERNIDLVINYLRWMRDRKQPVPAQTSQ